MSIALSKQTSLGDVVLEWFRREPRYAGASVLFLALALPTFVAMQLDDRTYQDINVWIKPMKFTLSVAVYLGTLAWFAGWMKWETRSSRWYPWFSRIIVTAGLAEIVWIYGAAANGIGSHYNTASPLMAALYSAAGVVVLILMLATPVTAWAISKNQRLSLDPAFRLSVILSLYLTFMLTVALAGYLASQPSHFVGGNLSDAEGGALFGWAKDGGDLRAAHFFALHAMHFIPAFALGAVFLLSETMRRVAVLGFSTAFAAFTIYVFVEALMGRPFLGGAL